MLEYFEELFGDKKTFTIFMVTLVVAVFVVLFFILKPERPIAEFAKYQEVNLKQKYEEVGKIYLDELIIKLRYSIKDQVSSHISENYLSYTGKTKTEVLNALLGKEVSKFSGLTVHTKNDVVVYTTNLVYKDNTERTLNLIEETPGKYEIAFDDFCSYKGEYIKETVDGITFKITNVYNGITKLGYRCEIANNGKDNVSFDISTTKKVALVLENGQYYYLTDAMLSNDMENIPEGKTINKNFEFSIPLSMQGEIKEIVFFDVKIGNVVKDITVQI